MMMSVGFSRAEGEVFCNQNHYSGRIVLAASNSPTNVTLSGDSDAIKDAERELSHAAISTRILRVDTAYHSPLMLLAEWLYLAALKSCRISPTHSERHGTWFHSARIPDKDIFLVDLGGEYWRGNMVDPVLFAETVRAAEDSVGPFDACLEIGPQPALRGLTLETLHSFNGARFGTLDRMKDDGFTLGSALAGIWAVMGPKFVDFNSVWADVRTIVPNNTIYKN